MEEVRLRVEIDADKDLEGGSTGKIFCVSYRGWIAGALDAEGKIDAEE